MAEKEQDPKPRTNPTERSSISLDELQAVVNAAVSAALTNSSASGKAIADALLEARKPYVDPRVKANEEAARRSMKESAKREKEAFKQAQSNCRHKKGSNPLSWYAEENNSSFALHKLDTGEWIGICTNCTKVISSQIPDDAIFFQGSRGTNIRSAAGERYFADPKAVQAVRLGIDQKEIFVDEAGVVTNR